MTKKMMRPMFTVVTVVGLTCSLGACAGGFNPETDASSPVAPRVQALVDANRVYPQWKDFPRSSDPVPQPAEIAQQVNTLRATGGALAGEVSALQWQNADSAAFEREVAARVAATPIAPATAQTAAEIEAYAQTLRNRAKAPPPISRQ
ncbi:MAG TPA: hypothetical protein VF633_11020 [Brevundimonas sp.]